MTWKGEEQRQSAGVPILDQWLVLRTPNSGLGFQEQGFLSLVQSPEGKSPNGLAACPVCAASIGWL